MLTARQKGDGVGSGNVCYVQGQFCWEAQKHVSNIKVGTLIE